MTSHQHDRLLAHAAQRAKARPEYLAWVLTQYIEREHISEDGLAQHLGIATHALPHLALCLRPRTDHFADDVRQISARFHIDPVTLATAVRLVESFEALGAGDARDQASDIGLLMAARARKQSPSHQNNESRSDDHPGS